MKIAGIFLLALTTLILIIDKTFTDLHEDGQWAKTTNDPALT